MASARDVPDLDAEAEVDLGRYGRSLLERWWLLLAGLVAGAVVGYLTTLGGTQFFRGQAIVYMGQPLGILGANAVQALNTNPSAARAIVTSESVVLKVAARTGLSPARGTRWQTCSCRGSRGARPRRSRSSRSSWRRMTNRSRS